MTFDIFDWQTTTCLLPILFHNVIFTQITWMPNNPFASICDVPEPTLMLHYASLVLRVELMRNGKAYHVMSKPPTESFAKWLINLHQEPLLRTFATSLATNCFETNLAQWRSIHWVPAFLRLSSLLSPSAVTPLIALLAMRPLSLNVVVHFPWQDQSLKLLELAPTSCQNNWHFILRTHEHRKDPLKHVTSSEVFLRCFWCFSIWFSTGTTAVRHPRALLSTSVCWAHCISSGPAVFPFRCFTSESGVACLRKSAKQELVNKTLDLPRKPKDTMIMKRQNASWNHIICKQDALVRAAALMFFVCQPSSSLSWKQFSLPLSCGLVR